MIMSEFDVVIRRGNWTELVRTYPTLDEACVEYLRLVKIDGLDGKPDIVEVNPEEDPFEQN